MIGMDALTGRALAGADHLAQSVDKIIGTPIGSRVGRRDFGSIIPELLDQPLNAATRLRLIAACALAILRHEPRLRASRITFAAGDRPGAAVVTIEGTRLDAPGARPTALAIPVRALSVLA